MVVRNVRRQAAFAALWNALRRSQRPGGPGIGDRLKAVPRMMLQGWRGSYPLLGRGRLTVIVGALLYVISPVDAVPELFLSFLGLGDDAMVIAWLVGTVLAETDAFLRWEADRDQVVIGEVIG